MQSISRSRAATPQQLRKPTLTIGSEHPDVAELKQLLSRYLSNPKLSGNSFDALTDYAVRLFQYRMFLVEDGIVGPNTWQALYTGAPVNMPVLREGKRDAAVILLQNVLSIAGYGPSTGDSLFTPFVARNVSYFQEQSGLPVDGVVGPRTWHALSKTRLEDPTRTFSSFRINNQYKLHANAITDIAVEPYLPGRSRNIATASRDTTVRLWQANGEPIGQVYRGDRGSVSSAAFHPTRRQLISATFGGTVRISDDSTTTRSVFPARGGSVMDLAVEPAARYIATANGDGAVRLFSFEGDLLREVIPARDSFGTAESVAISAQGQLATAHTGIGANLWNNPLDPTDQGSNISTSRSANVMCFSPNGYKLAVARGPLVQIYSNQRHTLAFTQCPAAVTSLAFSASGRYLAMGCWDKTVYIFDLQANDGLGEIVFTLSGHDAVVTTVAFSRDPEFTFHSGDESGRLITWGISIDSLNRV